LMLGTKAPGLMRGVNPSTQRYGMRPLHAVALIGSLAFVKKTKKKACHGLMCNAI